MSSKAPSEALFMRRIAVVFAGALAIRLLHVWLLGRSPFFQALLGDARGYDEWARRIAGGDWIGSDVFYQAPLYPYFVGVVFTLFGHNLLALRIVQAIIGAASCGLLGLAGRRFFSERVGIVAGWALAVYAPAIFFDALIQKSVLDSFFLTLSLWLTGRLLDGPRDRRSWLGLGLAMGGLSLTRENALVFDAVILGWALIRTRVRLTSSAKATAVKKPDTTTARVQTTAGAAQTQASAEPPVVVSGISRTLASKAAVTSKGGRSKREKAIDRESPESFLRVNERVGFAATFLAGLAIVLLPVAVRNYAVAGGFYLTTSQFGPNFYIGNNPRADGTYASLRFGRGAPEYERTDATELAEHALRRTLTPAEVSSYWSDRALDFITGQPGAWLRLMGRKVALLVNATEMVDTEAQESHADWSWILRVGGWFGHFGVLAPLALAGLVLSWPVRSRLAVLYVMLAAYAASVLMFYVFARYRLPLVPMLLLFAASALATLPSWFRESTTTDRMRVLVPAALLAILCNWPVLSKPLMKAITETNLAVALQAEGATDAAATHYRRAIEIQPDYSPAYNNLGVLQRATGDVAGAIATYRRALSLEGDFPDAHYNLANALLAENKPDEAAEHFKVALQSIPDSAGAANNLGIALSAQNRPQDAVAAFRAAVAAEPNSAVAHRNLADALSAVGQIQESVAEFRRAIELDPKDPSAPYNLGVVLLQAGQPKEAVDAFNSAVRLAPESVDAHNNLGIALGSTGNLDAAIAEFKRALAIDSSSAEARRNLEMAQAARAETGGRRP
jgi:tetratricopeptide (TPR) repeat protein